jgi:tol-pal system protein YbgF
MLKRASLALFAVLLGAQAAQAALFDDEEARRRIEATNQRIVQMQRQLEDRLALLEQQAKSGGLADLGTQIQLLQGDLAKLRGQIEVVTYELEQSQKRQRDLYVDLDSRLRKIEASPALTTPPAASPALPDAAATPAAPAAPTAGTLPPPAGTLPPPVAPSGAGFGPAPPTVAVAPPVRNSNDGVAEQRAYDAALDHFKRGDYQGAIGGFSAFVKTYPRSPLASSAQYWIGNAQYAKRDYRASIATQRQLLKDFPDSSKAPDALLNIASAQADLGDNAAARRTLEELIAKYPKSDAGTRAKQRLGGR